DLSDARWPPPWDEQSVASVLATLERINRLPFPIQLPKLAAQREGLMRWRSVARAPEPFLALGLCDARWLQDYLPKRMAAETAARLDGDDLLHGDVKSGNICFLDGRCMLIDWNWACRGN